MRFNRSLSCFVLSVTILAAPSAAQFSAPALAPNVGWINTEEPLEFDDELKGHVVLLDFWTFCCINCIHVLADLEYLEERFADDPFVVVGVHSAKFENEARLDSVQGAVRRYGVHHPVVVDQDFSIWRKYGARAWPTLVVIGADGVIIGAVSGEGHRDVLEDAILQALEDAEENGALAEKRFVPKLERPHASVSGLSFPGKVLLAPPTETDAGHLFIADSSNNRVIHAGWPDEHGGAEIITVFGGPERAFGNGRAEDARFADPQGMALTSDRKTLYVADTRNHAIRRIDLEKRIVTTFVGDGIQGRDRKGGMIGRDQRLSSPWALELSPDDRTLYIAMAGTHQLWSADTKTEVAKVLAGSGWENITDAPAPDAALAQPSGLALSSDASRLYFADSEVSAIRYLDFEDDFVRSIVGKGLFDFGDIDGSADVARLQHALGVAVVRDGDRDRLIVADTYNDKLKWIDPDRRLSTAWSPADGTNPTPFYLNEPAGLDAVRVADQSLAAIADTNNHRVLLLDLDSGDWTEVFLRGSERSRLVPGADANHNDSMPSITAKRSRGKIILDPEYAPLISLSDQAPLTVVISEVRNGNRTPVVQRTFSPVEGSLLFPDAAFESQENREYVVTLSALFEQADGETDSRTIELPLEIPAK